MLVFHAHALYLWMTTLTHNMKGMATAASRKMLRYTTKPREDAPKEMPYDVNDIVNLGEHRACSLALSVIMEITTLGLCTMCSVCINLTVEFLY